MKPDAATPESPEISRKRVMVELLDKKIRDIEVKAAQNDLLRFTDRVYPNYSVGAHHKIMARLFKEVAEGKKKRIIVNRHGSLG